MCSKSQLASFRTKSGPAFCASVVSLRALINENTKRIGSACVVYRRPRVSDMFVPRSRRGGRARNDKQYINIRPAFKTFAVMKGGGKYHVMYFFFFFLCSRTGVGGCRAKYVFEVWTHAKHVIRSVGLRHYYKIITEK